MDSLDTLWDGEYADRNTDEWRRWESVVDDLSGAIAAVGNHAVYIKTHKFKYSIDLPEQKVGSCFVLSRLVRRWLTANQTYRPNDFSCAWALMSPSQPLLLFNDGSVLHILNPTTKEFLGSLAGHGGVRLLPQQAGYVY